MQTGERPIIFYDGQCGLCQGLVRWVVRCGGGKKFYFAPLGGITYKSLKDDGVEFPQSDSVIFYEKGVCYDRSEAVIRMARYLPIPWSLLAGGRLVPRRWRDNLYDFFARRRRRWFGPADHCMGQEHPPNPVFLP
ncbi:MAG: DCC1-like thiol-disulfide oxidoreductase family protein [Flavobacteriales bacterium]|nr:DCC1-like thiol-disulfide oxidoreductase family protein [Flavobacteriales bacterium]MCX7767700.1 DCC1-like thiol-disulfide oxidoreductase family protein [Flavobacteriales bacterium]MDW8409406.1 DCC1-like thiol-disulfide oxidoreductase family protein [Flavobacteriales bacterium]